MLFTSYSGVGFDLNVVEDYRRQNVLGYVPNVKFLISHITEDPLEFFKLYLRKFFGIRGLECVLVTCDELTYLTCPAKTVVARSGYPLPAIFAYDKSTSTGFPERNTSPACLAS